MLAGDWLVWRTHCCRPAGWPACLLLCLMLWACDSETVPPNTGTEAVESVATRAPGLMERAHAAPEIPAKGVARDEALSAYRSFEAACQSRDVEALWALLSPGGRADAADGAEHYRRKVPEKELKKAPSYDGIRAQFGAKQYLEARWSQPDGPCPEGEWTTSHGQPYDELYLMVRHAGKACEALWFARDGQRVSVYPAGWNDPCPAEPAAHSIAALGERGRKLREAKDVEPITKKELMAAYEKFRKACIDKDVDALWAMLSDAERDRFEQTAMRFRDANDPALFKLMGHKGPAAEFGWREVLADDLKDKTDWGICDRSKSWEILEAVADASPPYVAVSLPGHCQALRAHRKGGRLTLHPTGWHTKCPPATPIEWLLQRAR